MRDADGSSVWGSASTCSVASSGTTAWAAGVGGSSFCVVSAIAVVGWAGSASGFEVPLQATASAAIIRSTSRTNRCRLTGTPRWHCTLALHSGADLCGRDKSSVADGCPGGTLGAAQGCVARHPGGRDRCPGRRRPRRTRSDCRGPRPVAASPGARLRRRGRRCPDGVRVRVDEGCGVVRVGGEGEQAAVRERRKTPDAPTSALSAMELRSSAETAPGVQTMTISWPPTVLWRTRSWASRSKA